jgi:hypothetical protein
MEFLAMLKTFIDYNMCIDIVPSFSTQKKDCKNILKYDIIFGFGESFFNACNNNPNALKIAYITESHPKFSLEQENNRLEYYFQRHKKRPAIVRSGVFYKEEHINSADYAIIIGNHRTLDTFRNFNGKLYSLTPTAIFNPNYEWKLRDYSKSKKRFVWFGGNGCIHKGLDLLIDIFSTENEYTLYICGMDQKEKKYLHFSKNTIDLGIYRCKNQIIFRFD